MFQVFQITTVRSFYVLLHAVCIIISFHMEGEKKTTNRFEVDTLLRFHRMAICHRNDRSKRVKSESNGVE